MPVRSIDAPTAVPWVPMLMYHRVVPHWPYPDPYRLCVSTAQFEAHMRFLKTNGYRSVSVDDWAMALRRDEKPSPKQVVITFDDGYLDVYHHALPILQKYGFTATIFLVSDCLGGTNVWDRGRAPETRLLGLEHIRDMHKNGISFGSHSVTHRSMPRLSQDDIWEELTGSRAALEQVLDAKVISFAFPYGHSNAVIRGMAEKAGYMTACGVHNREHALFNAPRINAARFQTTGLRWQADLAGLYFLARQAPLLRRMKRLLRGMRGKGRRRTATSPAAPRKQ